MENPIQMDDLGVPLFSETPIYCQLSDYMCHRSHLLREPETATGIECWRMSFPKRGGKNIFLRMVIHEECLSAHIRIITKIWL